MDNVVKQSTVGSIVISPLPVLILNINFKKSNNHDKHLDMTLEACSHADWKLNLLIS